MQISTTIDWEDLYSRLCHADGTGYTYPNEDAILLFEGWEWIRHTDEGYFDPVFWTSKKDVYL